MADRNEQVGEPVRQPEPLQGESQKQQKTADRLFSDHGGAWSHVHAVTQAAGGQEPPPEYFTPIFRSPLAAAPANDEQRARVLGSLQEAYGNRYVGRVLEASGEGTRAPRVQRQGWPGEVPETSVATAAPASGGYALDTSTRSALEPHFGRDLGDVRIHTDSAAQSAAGRYNANAFTTGRNIYFGAGQYDPSSRSGRGLIAHELTHVVQQDSGNVSPGISHPSDPHEREAAAVQSAVVSGSPMPDLSSAPRASTVQRQARPAPGGGPARPDGPAGEPAGAAAGPGDFLVNIAGIPAVLPMEQLVRRFAAGNQVSVTLPNSLVKFNLPGVKSVKLTLDLDEDKKPVGGSVSGKIAVPRLKGDLTGSVDKAGNASGQFDVEVGIPGLKRTNIRGGVDPQKWWVEGDADFEIAKVSGTVKYAYKEGKHSGKAKGKYTGAKFTGEIEIVVAETGDVTGSGKIDAELFKGLKASADVAIDEKRNVKIEGKLAVPGQIELFPEKKYEKSFFSFEKKFPLWGITIPVIDVNVGLFAEIHANAGFRAKFGPGVLRGIELSGEFGTDPETVTEIGLTAEFFLPAGAEVVVAVGGGIGLGLAIADITGGVEAQGVAGLYSALSVKPNLKYSGGKYSIGGTAEIAGVAQLKLGINAFAKIDVGVWLFKGTVWRKDWNLAEWIWNTGLNVALRANVNYTFGEDFAPDFSFESGSVDPEKLVRDVMPESGSPVPAPAKPPVPDKAGFQAEGAQGEQKPGAGGAKGPSPGAPGSPPAKTQPGKGPVAAPGATPPGQAPPEEELPPAPPSLGIPPEKRTEEQDWQAYQYDILKANMGAGASAAPVQRAVDGKSPGRRNLEQAFADFQSKQGAAAMSLNAFKTKFKTHYYDDASDSWVPKKFRVDGNHAIPLTPDGQDADFLVPQEKYGSRKQHVPQDPLATYQAKASGGGLVGQAAEEREDVRRDWIKLYPETSPWYPHSGEDVDHILELQVGGANAASNLQLLPAGNNRSSGAAIRAQISRQEQLAAAATSLSSPTIKWTKAKLI